MTLPMAFLKNCAYWYKIRSGLCALLFLAPVACTRHATPPEPAVSLQAVRQRTVIDFIRSPDEATRTYRQRLAATEKSESREVVAENLTACGELMLSDPQRRAKYLSYVLARVNAQDVELQAIAISALHGDVGEQSLDLLFTTLNAETESVQIAAIGAVRSRAGLNQSVGSAEAEQTVAKSRLDAYCRERVPPTGLLRRELCRP